MKLLKNRLGKGAIKESLDNLPSGICFFSSSGLLTLCNRQMYRLVYALSGRDIQSLSEFYKTLRNLPKCEKATRDGEIFLLEDGSAWHFSDKRVSDEEGYVYTQFLAVDVTQLYCTLKELKRQNAELIKMAAYMDKNVATMMREEETLRLKMRVHSEVGSSLLCTRQYLLDKQNKTEKKDVLLRWQRILDLLSKRASENAQDDSYKELMDTALAVGAKIVLHGELPQSNPAAYLIVCAMRECLTNVIAHAEGDRLYVSVTQDENSATAVICNNGTAPQGEIVEGGGLGTLRRQIYKARGSMSVQSLPHFSLRITVPLKGDVLI